MQNANDGQGKKDISRCFEDASIVTRVKEQLSHRQMLAIVDTFHEWAVDPETPAKNAIQLVEVANGIQQLAEMVGQEWAPPEPEKLSTIGFVARECEKLRGEQEVGSQ